MNHVNIFYKEEKQAIMVIEWKERDHDDVDRLAMEN